MDHFWDPFWDQIGRGRRQDGTKRVIKSFKDDQPDGLLRITAVAYVARDSQKGIIIGKQGKDIKRLGTKSRAALEEFFGKQVFLDLKVQVSKDWRFKSDVIKRYGYGE